MTANLPNTLRILDENQRSEHYYVSDSDNIYFFGEYEPNKRYNESEVNSFIGNIKKNPDRRSMPDWRYKAAAIDKAAERLSSTCTNFSNYIWVPVPSSKIVGDPQHDNRLVEILNRTRLPDPPNIKEIITQKVSAHPHHLAGENRPNVSELRENYIFHNNLLHSDDSHFVIFDDLLTAGCHFKACKDLILEWKPLASIVGIFLARRKCSSGFENVEINISLPSFTP